MNGFNYLHQDNQLSAMADNPYGLLVAPTGTGKGTIIERDVQLTVAGSKFDIRVVVSHRIVLSTQLAERIIKRALNEGYNPIPTIAVHSGSPVELSDLDAEEDKIWLAATKHEAILDGAALRHRLNELSTTTHKKIVIATTYHSLSTVTLALNDVKRTIDNMTVLSYLDEIHRGVGERFYESTLKHCNAFEWVYGFSATAGAEGSQMRNRIESVVGPTIYEMEIAGAIDLGIITKPRWAVTQVDGQREKHLANGVYQAFREYANMSNKEPAVLVHTNGSQEIQTIVNTKNKELRTLFSEFPSLLVADISSQFGPRLTFLDQTGKIETHNKQHLSKQYLGIRDERTAWLKAINEHTGSLLVVHIDICNAGIDVPGFEFGLWTYMPSSESYIIQGIGRSGRLSPLDRAALESGILQVNNKDNWDKPYNTVGLLSFSEDPDDVE